jgi:hypothetical protein
VGDYVLRRHPSTKIGEGPQHKLGTFWQGPYLITDVLVTDEESIGTICTIENLITGRQTKTHISLLKPFYWDKNTTTPINVAAKDSEEFVVDDIINPPY